MTKDEAIINTPVIYWRYAGNIVEGVAQVKSHPVFTLITGSPWALPDQSPIVNVAYQRGGAPLIALDVLTLKTLQEAREAGIDEGPIYASEFVSNDIKLVLNLNHVDKHITGDFLHKTAEGITIMGDGLKAFDKNEIEEFGKETAPDDYEQYGPEWEREVMKLPKSAIVKLYRGVCIDLQVAKDANWKAKN